MGEICETRREFCIIIILALLFVSFLFQFCFSLSASGGAQYSTYPPPTHPCGPHPPCTRTGTESASATERKQSLSLAMMSSVIVQFWNTAHIPTTGDCLALSLNLCCYDNISTLVVMTTVSSMHSLSSSHSLSTGVVCACVCKSVCLYQL
jgi:hypothetical protein